MRYATICDISFSLPLYLLLLILRWLFRRVKKNIVRLSLLPSNDVRIEIKDSFKGLRRFQSALLFQTLPLLVLNEFPNINFYSNLLFYPGLKSSFRTIGLRKTDCLDSKSKLVESFQRILFHFISSNLYLAVLIFSSVNTSGLINHCYHITSYRLLLFFWIYFTPHLVTVVKIFVFYHVRSIHVYKVSIRRRNKVLISLFRQWFDLTIVLLLFQHQSVVQCQEINIKKKRYVLKIYLSMLPTRE